MNKIKLFLSAVVIGAFLLFAAGSGNDDSSSTNETQEVVYNSSWDSSVRQVKDYLKKNLKDPNSYESIEWSNVIKQSDGSFIVRHKYRAKNSFGGYVVENKVFALDQNGNVIGSIDYE